MCTVNVHVLLAVNCVCVCIVVYFLIIADGQYICIHVHVCVL